METGARASSYAFFSGIIAELESDESQSLQHNICLSVDKRYGPPSSPAAEGSRDCHLEDDITHSISYFRVCSL